MKIYLQKYFLENLLKTGQFHSSGNINLVTLFLLSRTKISKAYIINNFIAKIIYLALQISLFIKFSSIKDFLIL